MATATKKPSPLRPGESRGKCMSRNLKGHKGSKSWFGRVSKACSCAARDRKRHRARSK